MVICIFGMTCVGKSRVSRIMAKKIKSKKPYVCFDVDDEIKKEYGTITKFQKAYPDPIARSIEKQKMIINSFKERNVIIPVSALHDISILLPYYKKRGFKFIEIARTIEDLFDRLIYTDDNDEYDEDYTIKAKNKYKEKIIEELKADEEYFSSIYEPLINYSYQFIDFTEGIDSDEEIAYILMSDLKLNY